MVGGIAEFLEASADEDASPIGFVFHFVDFKGDVWPAPHEADLATAGGVAVQAGAIECVADRDEVDTLHIAYADAAHAVTRNYRIAFRTAQFAKHDCLQLDQRGLAHGGSPKDNFSNAAETHGREHGKAGAAAILHVIPGSSSDAALHGQDATPDGLQGEFVKQHGGYSRAIERRQDCHPKVGYGRLAAHVVEPCGSHEGPIEEGSDDCRNCLIAAGGPGLPRSRPAVRHQGLPGRPDPHPTAPVPERYARHPRRRPCFRPVR